MKETTPSPLSTHRKPEGMTLEEWQIALRRMAASKSFFKISAIDEKMFPGDYQVSNPISNNHYKVVYRGPGNPWNYCSCFDFKTSQLGTCKHIESVKRWIEQNNQTVYPYEPPYTSVYLSYKGERKIRIRFGPEQENELRNLAAAYFTPEGALREECLYTVSNFLQQASRLSRTFRCYPDAMEFILEHRERKQREQQAERIVAHKDLERLLKVPLYPYQEEGILFAFRAGRSILADEMGLGKTIQAIGTAELLKRQKLCTSVLILCPTSLKYQWQYEIERFTGSAAIIIEGNQLVRNQLYAQEAFYKIVSYNTLSNDVKSRTISCDLLIMDEAQRLKNWKTQISQAARRVQSCYTLVLSGTPLQNKLEELYGIVQFVDQYCLGPYYRFIHDTTVTNESGQIIGYQGLNTIGEKLKHVLLRRLRREVALQLPARTDRTLRVPMTRPQRKMHDEYQTVVAGLVQKWKRTHYLTEKDRNRLLLSLSQMRMVCDSTYILDPSTRHDTKITELINILTDIYEGGDEKVVVFSQWERMTRIVAQELDRLGIKYTYLHGGVPSSKRSELIRIFSTDPEYRVFLSTDAGSTGLNLQAASVLINLDLPWNPATLEQRVSRIYRIGQETQVQVVHFISQHSIEERMLATLHFKASLFQGVFDGGNDEIFLENSKFDDLMESISSLTAPKASGKDESPQDDFAPEESEKEETGTKNVLPQEKGTAPAPLSALPRQGELFGDPEEGEEPAPSPNRPPESGATSSSPKVTPSLEQEPGITHLSQLLESLSTPEKVRSLTDKLVKYDPHTARYILQCPVPDKDKVADLLLALGRLLGGGKP